MYWTNQEPLKHPTTRILRGLTIPGATQYCFVVWEQNEQQEPGDTITHTFIKEPWPVCETRWFVFRGTIDGDKSNSISAIFTKHRVQPPIEQTFYTNPGTCNIIGDGRVQRSTAYTTWDDIHDGPGTAGYMGYVYISLQVGGARDYDQYKLIARIIITFDTSTIPVGSQIVSAKLHLHGYNDASYRQKDCSLAVYKAWPDNNCSFYTTDYHHMGTTPCSEIIPWADLVYGDWNTINLNEAGLSLIVPGGITALAVREATYDAPDIHPPGPKLTVAYIPP